MSVVMHEQFATGEQHIWHGSECVRCHGLYQEVRLLNCPGHVSDRAGVGVSVVGIPNDKINNAATEAIAKALVAAEGVEGRCVHRMYGLCHECAARTAFVAAVPYIEAEIRAKIAAEIEAQQYGRGLVGTFAQAAKDFNAGIRSAARVARGTQETPNGG